MTRFRKSAAALLASAALAGCTMIPTYERPPAPVPATYPLETTPAQGLSSPAAADVDWQRFFADPRLKRLNELSLASNRDLRVAVLNIEQARALYDVRRADQLPTVGIGGSAARAATANGSLGTVYTVGAAVSGYELDLFGRVRSLSESALNQERVIPLLLCASPVSCRARRVISSGSWKSREAPSWLSSRRAGWRPPWR